MKRLLITICTYNEVDNIRQLLEQLRAVATDADILVIDDNSPDGTGDVVTECTRTDDKIRLLHREQKEGLGAATLAGFMYAIEHGYDQLLNMDADLSHAPEYIPAIRKLTDDADVAIGSRYVPGGKIEGWGLKRHFMSRSVNIYTRLLLGLKTKDNSGSFRCYSVARLSSIDWTKTLSRGYAFQEEVLYRCKAAGCTFAETPITFVDRRYGNTKINMYEAVAAVLVIFRLGLQRLMGRSVTNSVESSDGTPT